MSTLYLIRHGQACFGSDDYDRLSPDGQAQVAHLREHLKSLGHEPDGLWCGRLRRQADTAAILAEGSSLRPQLEPAFDEYQAEPLIRSWVARQAPAAIDAALRRAPQSGSARDYQRLLEAAGQAWIRGELDADGTHEPWRDFRGRVAAGLDALTRSAGRGRRIAVCTSAGVIGAALGHVLALDDLQALTLSWSVRNASLTVLLFDERRVSISSFNGLPHLERPGLARLITYR